ncbi:response regulator transcription factor [Ileibacterium valens]|uniref:response regulator transcription factor n=2 Tax=Ileibacterium valens TaxID=1862668 RepID=UPI00259B1990|nr:response regulator transcription factor [Ileibacterium valens]
MMKTRDVLWKDSDRRRKSDMKQPCILVVEDDRQIRTFLQFVLEKENYICLQAGLGKSALEILSKESPDVILLDLGLPDVDGMILIQKIREDSDIPILVISARDQDEEKAAALDLGADDYLTKPFSATELLARIRTAIRHSHPRQNHSPAFKVGNLELNTDLHKVFLNENEIHLTPLEFKLLETFFLNPGKVLTAQMIIQNVYGIQYAQDTRALRTLMAGLRRKIEPDPGHPIYILTEIGVGYRLVDGELNE